MAEPRPNERMEKIVSLCKRRGFIFQSSEVYGGLNGFWDYGPLGAELKRNVKEAWWKSMTRDREDVAGLDASIIMHPMIWKASGHVDTFSDPMVDCLLTQRRFRADQVEPQSGTVYKYSGAYSKQTSWSSNRPFEVLIRKGENAEKARKVARLFYTQGVSEKMVTQETLQLLNERTEEVENSRRYNPENGSLLTEPRPFNLMLQTYVGPIQSEDNIAYLRPETAQAIFVQFKNVLETSRQKVPFGICQIGKAFRNEITPRNYIFRSREFEQMELEFFIAPDEITEALAGPIAKPAAAGHPGEPQPNWGWQAWHKYWVEERLRFYENIGLPRTSLKEYWQTPAELAHYARATVDILYEFPFGTEELEGIAARGHFDLSQHAKFSGKSMDYFDEPARDAWKKLDDAPKKEIQFKFTEAKFEALLKKGLDSAEARAQADAEASQYFEKLAKGLYVPHVIEPSAGVDRLILALVCNAYHEEEVTDEKGKTETRIVMRFHPRIAPIKVGVFPLLKNRPELVQKAVQVRDLLRPHMNVFYDDTGAIGRRYRRQDEAGTPFGVTIDFDTLGENPELKDTVTLRDRDTMKQERVRIGDLVSLLVSKIR
jgi:glycyl-tRNA synthetase